MSDFNDTASKLLLSFLVFLPSVYHFTKGERRLAVAFLILGAMAIRFAMISLDPFLHDWDERFHALVAKHLMDHPFKPMLRLDPVLPYDYKEWCCNHIWVHKQPLFLWQMALSMKIFGVNTLGLRMPEVFMGAISVWFVYRIATRWTNDFNIAYLSAFLYALSYYQLELASGRMSLDHNDTAFTFYVTGSIWAFCEYVEQKNWKYALLIGAFSGAAILVKWLSGLLIFGGWGLYVLLDRSSRTSRQTYWHFGAAFLLSLLIAMPWQWYIMQAFPLESAWSYEYNRKHIFEDLSHPGDAFFHLNFAKTAYGKYFLPFLAVGIFFIFRKSRQLALSISMLAMCVVIYLFFSLVTTKMPAFTFPVSAIIFTLIAVGLMNGWYAVQKFLYASWRSYALGVVTILLGVYCLKPWEIADHRGAGDPDRNAKLNNTAIYKRINESVAPDVVIINCKSFEDNELMFWQPNNAYHWFPNQADLQAMLDKGYKVAAFQNHGEYGLPDYITNNPAITIIHQSLQ